MPILATVILAVLGAQAKGALFKKSVIDRRFLSEGVAVADVNRDGKLDIIAGNVWFQAPGWQAHEIGPVADLEPKTQYSDCFHAWAEDLNRDGWQDQIVIGKPGEKAVWRENPKGKPGYWREHLIWHSAGNESPLYVDLFKNGKRNLVMGTDDECLAWFEPAADPYAPWICHPISGPKGAGSQRYSHGLGTGDVNGDRRNEVLTTGGYYVAPKVRTETWRFVPVDLGPDCAHMLVHGKAVLTTSAHRRGFWSFDLTRGFKRTEVDASVSETHSANLMKIGNTWNLITGKRKWAHPPGVDEGSEEASLLIRYELEGGKWQRHVIDDDSGVGTQFVVRDMNRDRKEDIVVSNKNGVFLFTQR